MIKECPVCSTAISESEWMDNCGVCPNCGHHFSLSFAERRNCFCEKWEEINLGDNHLVVDPLDFKDKYPYKERLEKIRNKTGLMSAINCGICQLSNELLVAMGIFNFEFLGGTMGIVVGEKLRELFRVAVTKRIPVVIFFSSGGARMQEGLFSLMQMAKVTVIAEDFKKTGLPFISVITHPTTGGVLASIAYRGDIVIAEPGADIGFTGKRVIKTLLGYEIPEEFQKSEHTLWLGFVDKVVDRRNLKEFIIKLLNYLI